MVTARRRSTRPARARRDAGFALMDAVIAGVLLAIGMVGVLSVVGQAMSLARRGETDVRAAAAIDELLSMVITEGPVDFADIHPVEGEFGLDSPYADFSYAIRIQQGGSGIPAEVEVALLHEGGRTYRVATLVAERRGEEPNPLRTPETPIDRAQRIEEREARREGRPITQ